MSERRARKLARQLGLSISNDGLVFTVCGGQLVNGEQAPPWIAALKLIRRGDRVAERIRS